MDEQTMNYESLADAFRRLTDDDNVKLFSSLVKSTIPSLRQQLRQKEEELEENRRNFEKSESETESVRKVLLSTHHKVAKEFEEARETLSQKNLALEDSIRKKDELVNIAQKKEEELKDQLENLRKDLESEKIQLHDTISAVDQLKKTLHQSQTEVEELNKVVQREESKCRDLESQLSDAKNNISTLNTDLVLTKGNLHELKRYAKDLETTIDESWLEQLEEIWEKARQLCQNLFKDDLHDDKLNDSLVWKGLMEYPYIQIIPLPWSNTLAAKNMRTVAILAILAREIHNQIFLPTYLLSDGRQLQGVLRRLAKKNTGKEAFLRAILLSVESDSQTKTIRSKIQCVSRKVAECVQDMISFERCYEFQTGLQSLVEEALFQWQKVQMTKTKHETSFGLGEQDYNEKQIKSIQLMSAGKETKSINQSNGNTKNEKILVVFPRVICYEDGESDSISNAVYLMKSQVNAANEEINELRLHEERKRGERRTEAGMEREKPRVAGARRNTVTLNTGNSLFGAISSGKPGKR